MRAQHAEGDKSCYLHQSRRRSLYDSTKDDFLTKFKSLLDSMTVQEATKGHRLVDVLDDLFSKTWIYARHLALMLECFVQYGYYRQTPYFGTYRVELVIHLYPRVIDLHNFELVMSVLSPYEAACVTCRIGFLRVFNPCKPEGAWELDLSRHEERLIVKMLCMLGIYEPGNNFLHASFRWSRDVEALPGWELVSLFDQFPRCFSKCFVVGSWLADGRRIAYEGYSKCDVLFRRREGPSWLQSICQFS